MKIEFHSFGHSAKEYEEIKGYKTEKEIKSSCRRR